MSNQSKFLPPILLEHVLKHCDIVEQCILRRVNRDFKQAIENVIWPSFKKLDLTEGIFYCPNILVRVFPNSARALPRGNIFRRIWEFLRSLFVHSRDEPEWSPIIDPPVAQKQRTESVENQSQFMNIALPHMPHMKILFSNHMDVEFLAKNCQQIEKLGTYRNDILKYAMQLIDQGVDISSHKFRINHISKDEYDMLDRLPKESKIFERVCVYPGDHIPERFHDNIFSCYIPPQHYVCDLPYFKNLKKFKNPEMSQLFVSRYSNQLKSIEIDHLYHTDKFQHFANLVDLKIERSWDNDEGNDEIKLVKPLIKYLESDDSKNLISFRVNFHDLASFDLLFKTLVTLDRPSKWKYLFIEYVENRSRAFRYLVYQDKHLELYWPHFWKLRSCFKHTRTLVSNCRTIVDFTISTFLVRYPRIDQAQFNNWKNWCVSYASQHRNKQVSFNLWPKRKDAHNVMIQDDNWTIKHHNGLIL